MLPPYFWVKCVCLVRSKHPLRTSDSPRTPDRTPRHPQRPPQTPTVTEVVYTTKVVYLPVLINPGSRFDSFKTRLPVNGEHLLERREARGEPPDRARRAAILSFFAATWHIHIIDHTCTWRRLWYTSRLPTRALRMLCGLPTIFVCRAFPSRVGLLLSPPRRLDFVGIRPSSPLDTLREAESATVVLI